MTDVIYAEFSKAFSGYPTFLSKILEATQAQSVCEIGGGANPLINAEAAASLSRYAVLDSSVIEIDKARRKAQHFMPIVADICGPPSLLPTGFDLVFSRSTAEHVLDGKAFHANVLTMLRPGGYALHFSPTLYGLPFVVNRILPESVSGRILPKLQGGRELSGDHGKFVAHYSWCYGPSRRHHERLRHIGYEVTLQVGFFGHDYLRKFGPLQRVTNSITRFWLRHPSPHFTTFSWLLLRRPEGAMPRTDLSALARETIRDASSRTSTG